MSPSHERNARSKSSPHLTLGDFLLVLSIPALTLIRMGTVPSIFAGMMMLGALLSTFTGVMPSSLPALFPTRIRYGARAVARLGTVRRDEGRSARPHAQEAEGRAGGQARARRAAAQEARVTRFVQAMVAMSRYGVMFRIARST
ncbi:general substrate transporter [Caballeronia temeraria]|uniref:General substrate transporter n=1 Tax=Caballeronia temeraria TaxID=1777137 RepID=A0A158A414_9BURK|nr:general substrate transporter [Caballeronia temeraria]